MNPTFMQLIANMMGGGGGGGSWPGAQQTPPPNPQGSLADKLLQGFDMDEFQPEDRGDDFRNKIAELEGRLKQDPAQYRSERWKDTFAGKHKIWAGIGDFLAGVAKQPGPSDLTRQQINKDFENKQDADKMLLQTVLGEERANRMQDQVQWNASRDRLKLAIQSRGLDINEAKTATATRLKEVDQAIEREKAFGRDISELMDRKLKYEQLSAMIDNNRERHKVAREGILARKQAALGRGAAQGTTTTQYDPQGKVLGSTIRRPGVTEVKANGGLKSK